MKLFGVGPLGEVDEPGSFSASWNDTDPGSLKIVDELLTPVTTSDSTTLPRLPDSAPDAPWRLVMIKYELAVPCRVWSPHDVVAAADTTTPSSAARAPHTAFRRIAPIGAVPDMTTLS